MDSRSSFQHISVPQIPDSPEGILFVRLAMAVNDAFSANSFLTLAKQSSLDEDIRIGLSLYAIRLQHSHLAEALKSDGVVASLKQYLDTRKAASQSIPGMNWLDKLFQENETDLNILFACLPNGNDYADCKSRLLKIRDKVTFHYDEPEVKAAIQSCRRGMKMPSQPMRRSTRDSRTRFSFVDPIVDREVFEIILGVVASSSTDVKAALVPIEDWINVRFLAFINSGSTLCWDYFKRTCGT